MNKIKNFNQYNESLGSWLKGLITGEKTEDDKIAKNLLKNVDNIEFREGPGLYPRPITFDYEGYRFYLYYGESEFYGNEVSYNDMMKIKSNFLKKLYDIAKIRIREKEQSDYKKQKEEKRLKLEKETIEFIEKNGGLEEIVYDILYTNLNKNKSKNSQELSSIFDKSSGIRYDSDDNYLYIHIDTFNYKGGVTSVTYDFNKFELEVRNSYPAYGNHKEYRMRVNKDHQWYDFLLSLKSDVIDWNKSKSKSDISKKKSILNRFK
jgi:hypothetical protein